MTANTAKSRIVTGCLGAMLFLPAGPGAKPAPGVDAGSAVLYCPVQPVLASIDPMFSVEPAAKDAPTKTPATRATPRAAAVVELPGTVQNLRRADKP